MLQFVLNPFEVLALASKCLARGGKIFVRVGDFVRDGNFFQFAHIGVLRSFLTKYSVSKYFYQNDIHLDVNELDSKEWLLTEKHDCETGPAGHSGLGAEGYYDFLQLTLDQCFMKFGSMYVSKYMRRFFIASLLKSSAPGDGEPILLTHNDATCPLILK